ncbi:TIR domain-containing protein [Pararobbsia alpina]|uniref:TIR domain-containing protein n=1 Tax=Pararobbsia alpina TaxID=621374 RepID=UPI0039A4D6C6
MAARVLEDVFVTEGVPEETFIDPPNFNDIYVDVRHPTKPVVIEGPSGTGKTSTIKKILERLGRSSDAVYLTARSGEDVAMIGLLVDDPSYGIFVIDDFHRLPAHYQDKLAQIAKLAADESDAKQQKKHPKLVLIGINEVGAKLIEMAADVAKRCGIHRIEAGRLVDSRALIAKGASALNVEFSDEDGFHEESRGDYWLLQTLCKQACLAAGVMESKDDKVRITPDFVSIRKKIVDNLANAYLESVKEFCRGRRFRPSNDPYYRILRFIATQGESSSVDLVELANANPSIAGSINNVKDHRLSVLIQEKPKVGQYLYYNRQTNRFSVEDPALFYYLRHLDWDKVRSDCGFRDAAIQHTWDLAISFAGENRELAKYVADKLKEMDVSVYFDEDYEVAILGKKLSDEFETVFGKSAKYVVCFLDKHHRAKIWPTFERDVFARRVEDQAVIPIYLDDEKFVAIPSDLYGISFKVNRETEPDWRRRANDEIVLKLVDKVA